MKIGICTVHYAHNYGAMLQGYALKTALENLGYDVVMIDRRANVLTCWNPRPLSKCSIKERLLYPKYLYKWYLPVYRAKKKRENNFERFLNTYLNNTPYNQEKLDAIVYGSDQIWSRFKYGYDEIWWGLQNSNTDKRISYAASMGVVDITDADEPFIKKALSRFDAVSVREKSLQDELNIRQLFDKRVELMVDPTFFLSKEEWSKLNPKRIIKEPYLLFYDFQNDEETTRIAHFIADQKHLRIIRLSDGVEHADKEDGYLATAGPMEFISLFNYADFIVSSSFHGTAFSIIFNKPFYVRQIWNIDRVKSLLEEVGLEGRFVNTMDEVNLQDRIDYSLVNKIVENCRCNAKGFLRGSIE